MLEVIIPRALDRYQNKRSEAGLEPDLLMTRLADIVLEFGVVAGRHELVNAVQDHYFGPDGEYGYSPDARGEARIILFANSIGALYLTAFGKNGLPSPRAQEESTDM